MAKFAKLNYSELETKKISDFETSFALQPLERGFANTLGNAVRRTLLSSVHGVSSFAVKVAGVDHEFQTITGVTEDVVQLILNLKNIRFVYNREIFQEGEVLKVTLKSKKGEVNASDISLSPGVEIVNPDEYIATTSKDGVLDLELFITQGRGFISFEENKSTIKDLSSKIDTDISNGTIIAIDSDFSPVVNVAFDSVELNSSSAIIEEKLTVVVKTDGSVTAKEAVAEASRIMIGHLEVLSNISNLERDEIFNEEAQKADDKAVKAVPISMLDLSVRSYNCLRRSGFDTLEDLSKITISELENIKNLGRKSVEEIIEKLEKNGVTLEGVK